MFLFEGKGDSPSCWITDPVSTPHVCNHDNRGNHGNTSLTVSFQSVPPHFSTQLEKYTIYFIKCEEHAVEKEEDVYQDHDGESGGFNTLTVNYPEMLPGDRWTVKVNEAILEHVETGNTFRCRVKFNNSTGRNFQVCMPLFFASDSL